jgi:deazaflavin-dependent oxidoreductase (nitroreductase family)
MARSEEWPMAEWDRATFTRNLIADLREHGGQATSGPMAGRRLLVLTATGARSGLPRSVVLAPSRDGAAYVVAGSNGGSPSDPAWLANVRANPLVTVEADGRSFDALATIVDGAAYDALWKGHVAALPAFADYPAKAGRRIPLVRLEPVAAEGRG